MKVRPLREKNKNAAQYLADMQMLSTKESLQPMFYDTETEK